MQPHTCGDTITTDARICAEVAAHPYPLVFTTVSGAHLYGFPSSDSDVDLRGLHVLPPREVLGLRTGPDTIERSHVREGLHVDLVTHDAHKFFSLLLRRNGYVLEQLYSPLVVHTSPEHQELTALVPALVTRHHAHHYLGFAHTQWRLFEKSHRVKPLLYVYRVLLTGIHLMNTGKVEANLPALNDIFRLPYLGDLIAVKMKGAERATLDGSIVPFHEAEFHRLLAALSDARDNSPLPDQPAAQPALHDLLLRLRLGRSPK
jgi:predicted nucleotidyltransferase